MTRSPAVHTWRSVLLAMIIASPSCTGAPMLRDPTLAPAPEATPGPCVLDLAAVSPARGSVLLVHGSAPFDADGRIPVPGLDSPYAREPFYKDVARDLAAAGWDVLRYAKPGVGEDGVDAAVYAGTDLAAIEDQLRQLWRCLPAGGPRVVLAWSEGTLHVRALPLDEVDAVILLGGIATNIGDVVVAQGGPDRRELLESLAGKDRREMLGLDRPVGRMLDELALDDNWRVFAARPAMPLLVLHGEADVEVPVSQAAPWREKLPPSARLTVVILPGRDHRLMPPGTYAPGELSREVLAWLEREGVGGPDPHSPLP